MKKASAIAGLVFFVAAHILHAAQALRTAKIQTASYNVYFGNLHAHTAYSDGNKDSATSGVSTPYASWLYAKNTNELDFLGISEHNHSTAGLHLSNWVKAIAQRDSFNTYATDTSFVALLGQEYGVISGGGHLLVYGTDKLFGWESGNYQVYVPEYDYTSLFNAVAANNGFCTLAHPQSSDYNGFFTTYNSAADGVVLGSAVSSGPAMSENTTQTDPATSGNYESRYHDALKRGYRVGATVDQDTHYTNFGMANQERTAVIATGRSETALLEALRQRRFYGTMDKNLRISMSVNGAMMGEEVTTAGSVAIGVTVSDPDGGTTPKIEVRYGIPGSGSAPTVLTSTTNSNTLSYTFNQTAGTTYYFYVYVEHTESGTTRAAWTSPVWNTRNDAGLATEPTNQPTGLAISSTTTSSMTVAWTNAAAGTQSPSGYLLQISSNNVFTEPVDGTTYATDIDVSDGKGIVNKTNDATTNYTFTGLECGTTYYFKMQSYNGSSGQINYKTDGTIPAVSGATASLTTSSEPSLYPSGFNTPTLTSSSVTVRWNDTTGTQLASGYLLKASISGSFTDPVDGVVYADDVNLSDGEAAVNVAYGVNQYTFTGLSSATSYVFKLYPYNGTSCARNYKTTSFPGTLNVIYTTSASGSTTPDVVVNEYFNGGSGVSEWVELLVLKDSLNMQGMKIRDYSGSGSLQNVDNPLQFTAATEWESVRAGTFIVIFISGTGAPSEDIQFGNKKVIIAATNTYYFSSPSSPFLIAATADAIEIYTGTNTHIHSLSHGSQPGSIATIPTPRANSTNTPPSGDVVRFTGTSSASDFSDNAKTGISATSTIGAPNDATQSSFVSTVLPVELVSFSVSAEPGGVQLSWRTATEVQNAGWEVQRKAVESEKWKVESWTSIAFISGSGSSSLQHDYAYLDKHLVAGRYAYRLKQIDNGGGFTYSFSAEVEVADATRREFELSPAYPNPFNPTTEMRFQVTGYGMVSLKVYNLLGQEVATLVNDVRPAGAYSMHWDASALPSGMYFARLESGGMHAVRKLMLMK